jgi:hypothetical protein
LSHAKVGNLYIRVVQRVAGGARVKREMQTNQGRHEEIIDDYDMDRLGTMLFSFQNNICTIANARDWLAEFGQVLPSDWACNFAAQFGRLVILKYFKQKGCGWSARMCAMTAVGGHLLVLT